jgi:hypothetical protein
MRKVIYLASFLLFTGLMTCYSSDLPDVKESRNLKGFSSISYGISGNLTVKIGPEFSVVLEGDEDDVERVVTEVSGDRLTIRHEIWRFHFLDFHGKVNVYITLPELDGLSVSGSGKAELISDIRNSDHLDLSVSGSGKLYAAGVETDELECSISGSGDIMIGSAGSADRGDISISGSGGYSGKSLEIDHLSVRVSGSGSCLCKAGDSLTARISGSGDVTYYGNPRIDSRASGSGRIRSAD